jgi:hypothetical protein
MGARDTMDTLILEATKSTPYILLDPQANQILMKGESYPENAAKFYAPVFSWIERYFSSHDPKKIVVDFELLYFNSSSSKALMNLLEMLEHAVSSGHEVLVYWHYNAENDLSLECGQELQEDAPSLLFNFVSFVG